MSTNKSQSNNRGRVQGTKPVRLRAACNPCHNAKIRCSGERDGCLRCRDLNHVYACVYSVSRVGRASTRPKQDALPDETDFLGEGSWPDSTGAYPASPWNLDVISGTKFNLQDLLDNQFMNQPIDWATPDGKSPDLSLPALGHADSNSINWQHLLANEDSNSSSPSSIKFSNSTTPLDFGALSVTSKADYEHSNSVQSRQEMSTSPPLWQQWQQQQESNYPHSRSYQLGSIGSASAADQHSPPYNLSTTNANSTQSINSSTSEAGQCISVCAQIISYLESRNSDGSDLVSDRSDSSQSSSDNSLGLDGLLRISKSCISSLLQVATSASCQANPNCFLLLCVAVNQITTLFENNVPGMNSLLHSLPVSIARMPSLNFGSFQADQEDQLAFCARLICREIQRCRQLLNLMSGIFQQQQQHQQKQDHHHHHHRQQHSLPTNSSSSYTHFQNTADLLPKQWFLASAERLDSLAASITP